MLGDATSVCSTSQDYLPTSIAPPIAARITPGSFMVSDEGGVLGETMIRKSKRRRKRRNFGGC